MKNVRVTSGTLSDFFTNKYPNGEMPNNPPQEKIQAVKAIPKKKLIEREYLEILEECTVEGNILIINSQLDRKTYMKINKIIESLGGQWNRNKKGHVFDEDPQAVLDEVVATGYYEKEQDFGYYPTPRSIVMEIIKKADIREYHDVLEPSAGQGHILDELSNYASLTCGELQLRNRDVLIKHGYQPTFENFLEYKGTKFDRIVMNPPFFGQADIDHVNHAYSLLKPEGRLVSIMSNGVTFRSNKKTVQFRELIANKGFYENLPEDSFYSSGTRVRTIIVVLNK